MTPYNFWQDFFDTYQSLADWIKALWLVVPPLFMLALAALVMRFRIDRAKAAHGFDGRLLYTIHRGGEDQLYIVSHAEPDESHPEWLLLDEPSRAPSEPHNQNHHTEARRMGATRRSRRKIMVPLIIKRPSGPNPA